MGVESNSSFLTLSGISHDGLATLQRQLPMRAIAAARMAALLEVPRFSRGVRRNCADRGLPHAVKSRPMPVSTEPSTPVSVGRIALGGQSNWTVRAADGHGWTALGSKVHSFAGSPIGLSSSNTRQYPHEPQTMCTMPDLSTHAVMYCALTGIPLPRRLGCRAIQRDGVHVFPSVTANRRNPVLRTPPPIR